MELLIKLLRNSVICSCKKMSELRSSSSVINIQKMSETFYSKKCMKSIFFSHIKTYVLTFTFFFRLPPKTTPRLKNSNQCPTTRPDKHGRVFLILVHYTLLYSVHGISLFLHGTRRTCITGHTVGSTIDLSNVLRQNMTVISIFLIIKKLLK